MGKHAGYRSIWWLESVKRRRDVAWAKLLLGALGIKVPRRPIRRRKRDLPEGLIWQGKGKPHLLLFTVNTLRDVDDNTLHFASGTGVQQAEAQPFCTGADRRTRAP